MSDPVEFVPDTSPRRWAAGRRGIAAARAALAGRDPFPGITEREQVAAGLATTEVPHA